jgi:hypothetical protein
MYDFTLIRKTLKETAEFRRRAKEAYRIPHHTLEHRQAKEAIPVHFRDQARDWATALHIAYAEARGKPHCNTEAWLKRRWDFPTVLKNARALITERVAIAEPAVGSA